MREARQQIIRITSNNNGYYDGTAEQNFEYAGTGCLSRWSYTAYSEAGDVITETEIRYDERGNIVENISTEYDAYETYGEPDTVLSWLEEEWSYVYDGNRLTEYTDTIESQRIDEEIEESQTTYFYNYDGNGRVTWYSYYDDSSSRYRECSYSYNEGIAAVEITDGYYHRGSYQPLTGEMEYTYFRDRYDMYTYDQYGNRIYSVAFSEKTNEQKEKPFSYIYRYTGE